jgi:hypothetical protein
MTTRTYFLIPIRAGPRDHTATPTRSTGCFAQSESSSGRARTSRWARLGDTPPRARGRRGRAHLPTRRFHRCSFRTAQVRGILVRSVYVPHLEYAQGAMVVNYPGHKYPIIRVHETKHASGQQCERTSLGSSSRARRRATTPSRQSTTGRSRRVLRTRLHRHG